MNALPGLDQTLHGLMSRYRQRVPDVGKITSSLIQRGAVDSPEDLANDHVAFRTLGVKHLGIASLEKMSIVKAYHQI